MTDQKSDNVGINTDKMDLDESELVYKPTTMELTEAHLRKQKFHSLAPVQPKVPKDSLRLYIIAFTANLLPFSCGILFSWTSPVLPKLMSPGSPLNSTVDASQASIIAAILSIGAAVGPFIYGYMADAKGRKNTLIWIAIPMAVSFFIMAFANDVRLFYLARLIQGVSAGGNFCVITMYNAEITEDHNRGKFNCYAGIFIALGVLYPFLVGPLLSVRIFCLTCAVPVLIFLVFFKLLCPESPLYLVKIGDQSATEQALLKLRYKKSKLDATKEYQDMRLVVEREEKLKGGASLLFSNKGLRNTTLVSSMLFILQQVSGINCILSFMEDIFANAGGAIPTQYATVLVGVIQVGTMFVTSNLIDRLGRKFLLLIAFMGCSICASLLGLYFYLQQNHFNLVAYVWWLPIFSLIVYIIMFNLGLGPGPWVILSEVFPANVKSFASAFGSTVCFASAFGVTLAFPIINEYLGMYTSFWCFGGFCFLGFVFTYLVVPETRGMTLDDIQQYFS